MRYARTASPAWILVAIMTPLLEAIVSGRLEDAKGLLVGGVDPMAKESLALRYAAQAGHLEIVRLLLPVSDPKAYDSLALQLAAENGHLEVVRLLLPLSDPKADRS